MSTAEPPNVSANAGDEAALSDPNSPESIALRAKKAQSQSSEDQRYDPSPPENFRDYVIVWENDQKRSKEISAGIFLALGVLLFLYKAAPNSI